jgi:hypothetical protein
MAAPRTFAALIDQDSVVILEYRQEKAGFRLVDERSVARRFNTPELAADAVVEVLRDMRAKNVALSIVLQHFGSFFHTLVVPPANEEMTRQVILREVQRSFNIGDPTVTYSEGPTIERREGSRAGGQVPRQMFIAGAPKSVVEALQDRFAKARIRVEGMTVIPDVFRRLYDALDGSTEATAVLVCLHNGPHVGFFVNGQLELAIEPPLALEGEAPLDTAVIIDQLERGAIFLRQQSRGTVATRLLLAAPARDFDSLSSTIEARTGMRVSELGHGVGTPETVVAMGAVLAAREQDRLDFYPRTPDLDVRVRNAFRGPAALTSTMVGLAAAAVLWCGLQVVSFRKASNDLDRLQTQVERSLPAVQGLRESAQGRERIAGLRAALEDASRDRRSIVDVLTSVANATAPGAQIDSIESVRVAEGIENRLVVEAAGRSGPSAMGVASQFYSHLQRQRGLKNLKFESSYLPRSQADNADRVRFTISFLTAPAGQK